MLYSVFKLDRAMQLIYSETLESEKSERDKADSKLHLWGDGLGFGG